MKKDLSALDIFYLLKELQILKDTKIDKIFHDSNLLVLQVHIPKKGKRLLYVQLPGVMFLSDNKGEFPLPDNFCVTLRKHLGNGRIREISQVDFERIVRFVVETKNGMYELIIELFSKGNIILSFDNKILIAKYYQKWKDRTIRGGVPYAYPKSKFNFGNFFIEDLKKLVTTTDRESIIKALAIDLGLGGLYAEEACITAQINKTQKSLSDIELKSLFKALDKLKCQEITPTKYEDYFSPFRLKDKEPVKEYKSMSEFIGEFSTDNKAQVTPKNTKLIGIIRTQEEKIKILADDIEENQKKGEAIYEKYAFVSEILSEINKATSKLSWTEIKEKLKGHKIIKQVNSKDKQIIIEI